ncbi:MAG: hypothetical protein NTV34_21895, partial [Proteobacteria bacterium]|nr:hypothetical protein [Pseudomonadota bacterium]
QRRLVRVSAQGFATTPGIKTLEMPDAVTGRTVDVTSDSLESRIDSKKIGLVGVDLDKALIDLANNHAQIEGEIKQPGHRFSDHTNLLIWQYVRFNADYREEFAHFEKLKNGYPKWLKPIKELHLSRRWNIHGGLPDPDIFHLPSGVKFVDHPVLVLNPERLLCSEYKPANEKYKEFLWERFYSKRRYGRAKTEPLLVQIHDFSSEKKVMAFVTEAFKKHQGKFVIEKPPTLRGSSIQGIVLNAIIWNLLNVKITSPTKITRNDAVQIINTGGQRSTQIERAKKQFLKISSSSPWCFFASLK